MSRFRHTLLGLCHVVDIAYDVRAMLGILLTMFMQCCAYCLHCSCHILGITYNFYAMLCVLFTLSMSHFGHYL